MLLLEESVDGSAGRVYTLLPDLSDPDRMLSFRYRLVYYGDTTESTVLPDSIEVYLADTEDYNCLILGADDEPNFDLWTFGDRMFFYQDSDPNQPYN